VPSQPANKEIRGSIEHIQTLLNPRAHLQNRTFPAGRPRLHIAARCTNLIREMGLYHYPTGTDTKDPKDVPVDKDNHAIAGIRYLLYSDKFMDGSKASSNLEDELLTPRTF